MERADSSSVVLSRKTDRHIWFGKVFRDAEGHTGVGDAGYFDLSEKKFTLLHIPEFVNWSASALLIEGETLWAGLESYEEGAGSSGGLLQYDIPTRRATVFPIEPSVRRIYRSGEALVIGTINGVYVFRDGRFTRHRAEPNINGKFVFVSDPP